jgi:hypothetical protein
VISGLHHYALEVPDLAVAEGYLQDFGLETGEKDGSLVARCPGRDQEQVRLVEAPVKRLHHVSFTLRPGTVDTVRAIFLYFLGPEGFTYEYSFGVRRIEDEGAWVPRTFDPAEPGAIDMWLGPTSRPVTQPQIRAGGEPQVWTGGPVQTAGVA